MGKKIERIEINLCSRPRDTLEDKSTSGGNIKGNNKKITKRSIGNGKFLYIVNEGE